MKFFKTLFLRLQMSKEQVSVLKQELKPKDINNFDLTFCQLCRGCFSNLWDELGDWSDGVKNN